METEKSDTEKRAWTSPKLRKSTIRDDTQNDVEPGLDGAGSGETTS